MTEKVRKHLGPMQIVNGYKMHQVFRLAETLARELVNNSDRSTGRCCSEVKTERNAADPTGSISLKTLKACLTKEQQTLRR